MFRVRAALKGAPVTVFDSLRNLGLEGTIMHSMNKVRMLASARELVVRDSDSRAASSASDDGSYPQFCMAAATDASVFERFRRHPRYMPILEHVSKRLGSEYLLQIQSSEAVDLDDVRRLATDSTGKPFRYFYGPKLGRLSPTSLRYLKVAGDLQVLFGNLRELSVGEIGIGYGGQCRVLQSLYGPLEYVVFDLPEVLQLSSRYLGATGVDLSRVSFMNGLDPQPSSPDLLVSNYAFSELTREVQDAYMENVVTRAARGYMTYNMNNPDRSKCLTAEQVCDAIAGAEIIPEVPLTATGNVIIVWGHQQRPEI